ncbi:polysaccharide biosynthesis/export family protein [Stenoxybacter acetivorans]|uniref:polysaccharide biosynthesis/export family protein n=1 Tax=Stenoxybacter acetivorans TaxID=422441 RepID=UPI000A06D5FC|nr:polysaccharide biosynthesis/export family protein [Stenoxybacter acetivorans]
MLKKLLIAAALTSLLTVAHADAVIFNQIDGSIDQQAKQNATVNQAQLQTAAGSAVQQPPLPSANGYGGVLGSPSRMYGAQLFSGMFRNNINSGMNVGYQIKEGDQIVLRMWGGYLFDGQLVVDPQGNIFIPNVGPVRVAGVANGNLNSTIKSAIARIYRANVEVYAALANAQPIKVFVTGFVLQPGLYGGTAGDSAISYLDKAGGVDPNRGSYIDIEIKRNGHIINRLNLYDFLLSGDIKNQDLRDGDVIMVTQRKHTFAINGDVYNPYDFEFNQATIPLVTALRYAKPKPGASHVSIVRRQGSEKRSEYYPISEARNIELEDGDNLTVTTDRYDGTIQVRIEGAHSGEHAMVLPYGSTMEAVLENIRANSMSQIDAIQLFRPSVAKRQKEMLNLELQKLQQATLTTPSSTSDEASLRAKEAEMVQEFVKRASEIQPKGQVVLNKNTLKTTLLEDGDVIVIPEKTSLVSVHGAVMFPNAVGWEKGLDVDDYLEKVGGLSQTKGKSNIIVIRQNGESLAASGSTRLNPGDEIMVLTEVKTKNLEVTRGITQILYQIAVAAKVVFGL